MFLPFGAGPSAHASGASVPGERLRRWGRVGALFLRGGADLRVDRLPFRLRNALDLSRIIGNFRLVGAASRRRLFRLLEREADAAPAPVGLEHPHLQLLSDLDDILGVFDVLPGQLRNVQQALDTVADLEEGAVLLDLCDLALDDGAGREALLDVIPGILAQLAKAERDPRCFRIQLDDLDLHVLSHLEHIADVGDAVPGELGDMDQAVGSAQVDERAVGRQSGHLALDLIADLQLFEELAPLARTILVEGRLLADDQPVALAVDLEDLDADPLADQLLEIRAIGAGDLGGRQEATQSQDVDDQATLVLLADLGVHHLAGGLLVLRFYPDRFGAGTAERQDDVAVLVFGLQDEDLDVVSGVQVGRPRLAGPQLAAGDDAFGFRADVDQNLIGIDAHDDTVDDVTVG